MKLLYYFYSDLEKGPLKNGYDDYYTENSIIRTQNYCFKFIVDSIINLSCEEVDSYIKKSVVN